MKMFLKKAIFVNRAPFENQKLNFEENGISVLSSINGGGKTTIVSHIVDAFHEMARAYHASEYEGRENKYYRISSAIHNLQMDKPSFVYLRFQVENETIDYVDIRNTCTQTEYNEAIILENKIPFEQFKIHLQKEKNIKKYSNSLNQKRAKKIFSENLLTYFPSYRNEQPGYLSDPYKIKLNFGKESSFSGYLKNQIEVRSGLHQLINWIMDVVLDNQYLNVKIGDIEKTLKNAKPTQPINMEELPNLITKVLQDCVRQKSVLQKNLNSIITKTLVSKKLGDVRFGIGQRNSGGLRVQIVDDKKKTLVCPSVFNLSSGESSMLSLFGELLRQADNIKNDILLSEINGIVVIDETDKHLHLKLQKEVLPELFNLFPNVQFIITSHSPFLSLGLAENLKERSKVIDLESGLAIQPFQDKQYKEVYEMMISENERFKEMYQSLELKIKQGTVPLIITEGKTDIKHIRKAKERLNIDDVEMDYFEVPAQGWGHSNLQVLLDNICKIDSTRKIIGIFDRDEKNILDSVEKNNQSFKDYGNNVFAFCIPIPPHREEYKNISIEFYYLDSDLKKSKDGKCLYFDNELNFNSKRKIRNKISNPIDDPEKKIYCANIGDLDWIHSKTKFADLVESDNGFTCGFNFDSFKLIFDKIKEIIDTDK